MGIFRRRKIYERSLRYDLCLAVVRHYIHKSFRYYECVGKENIPDDGALIFASNHCDALMDPLAVLAIDSSTKVFVARADIFSNPVAQKILTFMKILPIHRMRDGLHNVIKTEDTIEKSIEVVEHSVRFCIFPEGRHRTKHSLLPFGKGLSRIAYGAYKKLGSSKPIYLVPVGCEYGDYFRYRSTLLLRIGKPVNLTKYIEENSDNSENEILQGIRAIATEAIRSEIVYVPDDKDYDAIWTLSKIGTGRIPYRMLRERFNANRNAISKIVRYREKHPEAAGKLFDRALEFDRARRKAKISMDAFAYRKKEPHFAGLLASAAALFPLFLVAAIVSLPSWGLAEILASRAKDKAFCNALRCAVLVLMWSFLLVLALIPAPFFVYDYFELIRRTASAWRVRFAKKLKHEYETLYSVIDCLPDAD